MLEKNRHATAVGRAGGQVSPSKYLPDVPRAVHADGGKVAFQQGNHPDVPDVVYHGTNRDIQSFDPNAERNYDIDPRNPASTDTGWFGKGHYFAPKPKRASYYAEEAARRSQGKGAQVYPVHLSMKNPFVVHMKDTDSGATTLDKALNNAGVPMHSRGYRMPSEQTAALIDMGHDGVIAKREGKTEEIVAFHPNQIKSAIGNQGTFDPNDPDITKSDGGEVEGRVSYGNGGKSLGLYSKAAQIIRSQPQAKGSVDQLLAMVSKTKGVKPAELTNAGRPAGDTMSKEELAKHFEDALPKVDVERIGGRDSNGFPQYEDYTLPGGENYREHLLHLAPQEGSIDKRRKELEDQYKNVSTVADLDRITSQINALSNDDEGANFKSSHWNTPNVLAHVRMSDRDNGKTLHVHEVQSDWGQEGREKGFHDPKNPFEVINKKTKEVVSRHPDYSSMWDAYRTHPDSDNLTYGDVRDEKPPQGPYVGNTQQWTDLALKHVMAEAAKGGYERVVFSPGEANADLYGQRKEVSKLEFLKSNGSGEAGILSGFTPNGYYSSQHDVESHADLPKLIGKENAANLLAQPPTPSPDKGEDRYTHTLQGPLQVGGHGMVDYYKNYVNQGAMKLLQQHDQSAKPESYDLPEGYKGFALPVTDTARDSILKNGFQAFKRGGEVHKADGGPAMFQGIHPDLQNEGGAPLDLYHGTPQDKEFEAFDDAKLGARDVGFFGRGHYLTPARYNAQLYAGPTEDDGTVIGPLHAALKNPYVWDVSDDMKSSKTLRDLQSMGIMRDKDELRSWDNLQQHHVRPFMAEMQKRGHDGVIVKTGYEHHPNGISEVVAFDPKTIKHKEAEVFDPTDPRIRREDGGEVAKATGGPVMGYVPMASLTVPRLAVARAPQYQQQQGNVGKFSDSLNSLMKTVKGFKKKPEADAAVDSPSAASEGHAPQGVSEAAAAAYGRLVDAYGQPLTINSAYRDPKKNEEVGGAKGSQHLHGNAYDIDVTGKTNEERVALANLAWDAGFRGMGFYDNSMHFDVGDPRGWGPSYSRDSIPDWAQGFAEERYGYATGGRTLDKSGLYSKALEVARNIQQQRGTPAQFMAQLKNSKGVKPSEIEAIGMPSGDKMTRDEFVQHIAKKVPKLSTVQYGENPNYLRREEQQFMRDTWMKEDLSPKDEERRKALMTRREARPDPEVNFLGNEIEPQYEEYSTAGGKNYRERVIKLGGDNQYQSSHWAAPNVLAHIRMKDRDAPNGDRLLHVEEIQSDWGQDGRKKGFHDPQNPYEVIHRGTGQVVSKHPSFDSMMESTQGNPNYQDFDYVNAATRKIPAAPYVQNTQHWTDLAMKHIMREAALGDYDGVIFTPGQVHADRYGHEDASGMEGYYDNIVPKSALSTVQQHDPSIKPQTMNVNGEYDAMHIPLTSTAKDSILKNGFSMFNRGGTVDAALALTRGFTKDGKSAINALKPKGK
jgi:hypothetical protein